MQSNENQSNSTDSNNDQSQSSNQPENEMKQRVDRLGGEQAPDISPEDFARLQRSGALHIDAQGRVRANRREETDPGVSLRKRRAWYA
jgi:hypothetical protein